VTARVLDEGRLKFVGVIKDFEVGSRKHLFLDGQPICVFRMRESFVAVLNVCPHAGGPVCQGRVDGTTIRAGVDEFVWGRVGEILVCPWHGREFDLLSGCALAGRDRLKRFPTLIHGGAVYVSTGMTAEGECRI
jgi:nitrite reductase/ring-hydroxylating ferredoxin subunit